MYADQDVLGLCKSYLRKTLINKIRPLNFKMYDIVEIVFLSAIKRESNKAIAGNQLINQKIFNIYSSTQTEEA